ncbi:MAG: ABC transporter ATP-binding protein [Rhodospirillales bacterium]|nr:ABC transporter ATP-binding protein [Rhodospirillales bacterium]
MRLVAESVGVRYGSEAALRDVTLAVPSGAVMAVVGANGSGKSTLLRALAGLQRHDGRVVWDAGGTGRVGYMPQDTALRPALTAFEIVLLGRMRELHLRVAPRDLAVAEAVMQELGVTHLASRRIGTLSGGQRQLVLLAQVLAGDPAVLLLDEPTSALDIAHQLRLLALLRGMSRTRGLTIIATLHDLNAAARFADQVALLHQGRLLGCGPGAAILRPDLLRQAFGVEADVETWRDGHPLVLPLRPVMEEERGGGCVEAGEPGRRWTGRRA